MIIKTGGSLTIQASDRPGVDGYFDDKITRTVSQANWIPYDEFIAAELIVVPKKMYKFIAGIEPIYIIYEQIKNDYCNQLKGQMRIVREDGRCIDFFDIQTANHFLTISKNIIDKNFIHQKEGFKNKPYYPDIKNENNSGITVGYGIDLGGKNSASMLADGVPKNIIDKLSPYTGVKGKEACLLLKKNENNLPELTSDEALLLSNVYLSKTIHVVSNQYNKDSQGLTFSQIPERTRTAIIDVAYNSGDHIWDACPAFWGDIVAHDWESTYDELMNFYKYSTPLSERRKKDASLILNDINNNRFYSWMK
ncbi:hypothetical protein AU894_19255 [Salmonella enterica subsp. enterica]|uniref:Pesticin C-terminal domain-containing protein n=1 Tax=Salmonella enterica subsp. enterica serovar Java TaxID=224729 RepID=A0A3Y9C2W9_SALEB|nr:hypothetical protein [Salmonella enterica subsp. enterica serovar Java]EDU8206688.1 hypothetical protein [Salmonella enterica subsp. diarizonae]